MSKLLVILLAALSLSAQAPRPNPEAAPQTPEARVASMAALLQQQPDVQGLSAILRTLRTATKVSDEVKARAEGLSKEGASRQAAGATGEARMLLSQAAALLLGRPWGARAEFAASLGFAPRRDCRGSFRTSRGPPLADIPGGLSGCDASSAAPVSRRSRSAHRD